MNVLYEPRNWSFEVHEKRENVKINTPSIIIVAKKYSENHNSKFPYKAHGIYFAKKPEYFLNRQPVFNKEDDEVFLVLINDFTNQETILIDTVKEMKITFECTIAYNELEKI